MEEAGVEDALVYRRLSAGEVSHLLARHLPADVEDGVVIIMANQILKSQEPKLAYWYIWKYFCITVVKSGKCG
jgi:hypothetical protein